MKNYRYATVHEKSIDSTTIIVRGWIIRFHDHRSLAPHWFLINSKVINGSLIAVAATWARSKRLELRIWAIPLIFRLLWTNGDGDKSWNFFLWSSKFTQNTIISSHSLLERQTLFSLWYSNYSITSKLPVMIMHFCYDFFHTFSWSVISNKISWICRWGMQN